MWQEYIYLLKVHISPMTGCQAWHMQAVVTLGYSSVDLLTGLNYSPGFHIGVTETWLFIEPTNKISMLTPDNKNNEQMIEPTTGMRIMCSFFTGKILFMQQMNWSVFHSWYYYWSGLWKDEVQVPLGWSGWKSEPSLSAVTGSVRIQATLLFSWTHWIGSSIGLAHFYPSPCVCIPSSRALSAKPEAIHPVSESVPSSHLGSNL